MENPVRGFGFEDLSRIQQAMSNDCGFAPTRSVVSSEYIPEGRSVMRIDDAMVFGPVVIGHDATVTTASKLMNDQGVGLLIVQRKEHGDGVMTDRDIVTRCVAAGHQPSECPVETHTSRPVITVSVGADIFDAVSLMREHKVKRLGVVEDDVLVGIVSATDITQVIDQPLRDLLSGTGRVRSVAAEMLAGIVTHYYTDDAAAAVELQAPLHIGDQISVTGRTTDHNQELIWMNVNGSGVKSAFRGDQVIIGVSARVRIGDNVFIVRE